MKKLEFNLKPSSFFTVLCCLLTGLFFSTASIAQITPANCTQGCTSNDVQIQRSYLSDQAGNILPTNFVCPASGVASVYLTLELTTKTPRVGVTIFTRIKTFTGGTIGSEVSGSPISQCFGIALNQPTNKVTFQQSFSWTCGTAIVMTDIFIGWGTGNTNFCTGSAFQCPATPSKCYSLPPGSFVAIETPSAIPASSTLCSDSKGGTTATFNLNNITVTNSNNVTVNWWETFTNSVLSNCIPTPGAYSSGSKTVYAKIKNNSDTTVFSVSEVTLTVNQTPSLTITNPAAVCSPSTVDLTAAAVTAGSTLPAGTTLSYWTNSNGTGSVGTPSAVGAGTYYIKATTNTSPACSDIKAVTVTVNTTPGAPTVGVVNNCDGSSDLTATNYTGSLLWSNSATTASIHVTNAATYTVTQTVNGCTSGTGSGTSAPKTSPSAAPTVTYIPPTCLETTFKVSVDNPQTGSTYTLRQLSGGIGPVTKTAPADVVSGKITFTGLTVGKGYRVTETNSDGCISSPAACGDFSSVTGAVANPQTIVSEESQTTVKAYPNPFSDKINFVVTSAVAGKGNLEVYNMMGQKVKTVYTGFISAGTQTFELRLPTQQVSNLIYVLRVGNKKMSGKILQINQ